MDTSPIASQTSPPNPWGMLLQAWEGHVIDVSEDGVNVALEDKTYPDNPEAFICLTWEAIDTDDHPLVKEGAVFYWSVSENGSLIRFRRGLVWTAEALAHADEQAQRLFLDVHGTLMTPGKHVQR